MWYVIGKGVAMRKVVLIVGLLLCASYEGRAEAKRREPATRSQALADCQARVPKETECYKVGPDCFNQVSDCLNLINDAEAAFQAGRWHPSRGPWGNCGERGTGTSYGPPYRLQCSYLSNIDKDPEFKALVDGREEQEKRREEKIRRAEAQRQERLTKEARDYKAERVAILEYTLSQAAESIPGSAAQLRNLAKSGANPYDGTKGLLAEADSIVRGIPLTLGDYQTAEYEARIRALKERNTEVARQFVLQEAKGLGRLTKGKLRQYSPPRLIAQADVCAVVKAIADDVGGALSTAKREAVKCLTMYDELLPRAEEIYRLLVYLCIEHPEQQRALAEQVRRKKQVDRESGTRDLGLDRGLAELKITLREERADAIRRLKQLGAPYSKSKCSALE